MISPTESSAAIKNWICELPKGKTIVDVFADFMRYLFDSTKAFSKSSELDGELRWDSVSDNIELVLSHPNEWGDSQQTQLRDAAVQAGIVPNTPLGCARVHFVTEGEATFNFCATHTEAGRNLKVCHFVFTKCWFADTPAAWRASFGHRCWRRNDRYLYLHSCQKSATSGRRVV